MNYRRLTFPLAAAGLLLATGCTSEDQLKRVEQEVADMKLEVFKLRRQMEENGKKEDGERSEAAQARAMDRRFQADLQENLRQLQETTRILNNRLGDQPRKGGKAAPVVDTTPVAPPSADDEKAFGAAVVDYNRGNYPLAAEGLDLFLKSYPRSAHRADALFFQGLSHYNQKNYAKAMASFDQIIKENPGSSQFLPAKLKRAQCLLRTGLKPAAIKAFQEIASGFPGTPEARTARQELADLGIGD